MNGFQVCAQREIRFDDFVERHFRTREDDGCVFREKMTLNLHLIENVG